MMAVGRAPVIGVTSIPRNCETPMSLLMHETVPQLYLTSIRDSGGVPLILPVHGSDASSLVSRIDGLLLTGGGDVDPRYYRGDAEVARGIDEIRDEFEVAAVHEALDLDIPIFAICRGMQLLNVTLGGTLIGDLEKSIRSDHHWDLEHWDGASHLVDVEPDTHLARFAGSKFAVNSMHHQAVDRLGEGLRVSARSSDGVVEGVEMASRSFVVGVQWHPECLTPTSPHSDLFGAFIEQVRK
jgi:putative glutamine amidotransferase